MKKRFRAVMAARRPGGDAPVAVPPADWPLARPLVIGGVELPNRVVMAPLAGIGDQAFRLQAHRHGAGLVVSEMVAAMGLHHRNRRTERMLALDPAERITSIQLFGSEPAVMAEAARAVEAAGAAMVDINMGCPVPKICRTGAGAALLADPGHAARVVEAMVRAVRIPVTVKMRRGLTPGEARPVEAARRFEAVGAAAVTVHPRAAAEEYAGRSDHRVTAEVAAALSIPVIASGDITTPAEAAEVLRSAGCAAVMIGRAALGDPWVLGAMADGAGRRRPGLPGVVDELVAFAEDARGRMGDDRACHHLRKFYPWYLAGEDVPPSVVQRLLTLEPLGAALDALRAIAAGDAVPAGAGAPARAA